MSLSSSGDVRRTRRVWLAVRTGLLFPLGVYGIALAAYLLLRVIFHDQFWPLALLNNFAPFLFLPLLLLVPLGLLLRSRWIGILLIGETVIGLLWFGPYFLPKNPAPPSGQVLRVVTFNVWGVNPRLGDVEAWLRAMNPDLVLIQETPESYALNGVPALLDVLPYQIAQPPEMRLAGQIALSRYPILSTEYLNMTGSGVPEQQRLILDVNGQTVTVYNVHFMMPMRDMPRFRLPIDHFAVSMIVSYDDGGRNHEIGTLLEYLAGETGPVLVAGDFNMSDHTAIYEEVAARLGDSFREAGVGLGTSWPVPLPIMGGMPDWMPPVFRIDYLWHSAHFRAVEAGVGPRLGSDHLPHFAVLDFERATVEN